MNNKIVILDDDNIYPTDQPRVHSLGVGPHVNRSKRTTINTADADNINIRHRAKFSPKYVRYLKLMGCCFPVSCLLCNLDEHYQSTYAQIHEHRVEYNYPGGSFMQSLLTCIGTNKLTDNVGVHYFDKGVGKNMQRAKCCSPLCTHNSCFPECCGIFGETTVMYSDGCCGGVCCRKYVTISGLEDADRFVSEYDNAQYERCGAMTMRK